MKKTAKYTPLALWTSVFTFAPLCLALAADTNSNPTDVSAPTAAPAPVISAGPAPVISSTPVVATASVKLPYGVEDVLKLSRAQVSDDVIVNYVQSSGTIYNLTPREIVYLKEQGVSERVINTMLDQRKRVELTAQASLPPQVPPTGTVDASQTAPAPATTDPNAAVEAPLTPPASSVYTIPYPAASYAYYGPYYYPYYYGGWYGGPSVVIGFGGHGYYGGHGWYGGHYGSHAYGGYGGHGGGYGGHGGGYGGHGGHGGHR